MLNLAQFETCMYGIKNSVARVNRLETLLKQTVDLQSALCNEELNGKAVDNAQNELENLIEFLRWKVNETKKESDAYYRKMRMQYSAKFQTRLMMSS